MKTTAGSVFVLALITILFFAQVIFSSNTFISRDVYTFYNPKHFFAAENIKKGILPLWNPYLASGIPFQANVQSSIFYPLSLMFYLLPFQIGYKYFIIAHYFLGSLFMYLLMRHWQVTIYGSLVSGVVFAYGGYMVSILDNVCFLAAAIWLPFILLFHHQALKTGSYFYSCITAIGIALQIFAGDLSFYVLTTILSLVLYTLFWPAIKSTPSVLGSPVRSWCQLSCALSAGALLASVQILPMIELATNSTRYAGFTYKQVTKWSYHPLELLQLLVPAIFGSIVPQTRWFGQLWLDTFYIGIFPVLFAAFFLLCSREKPRGFLIVLLLCSLFLSIGQYNPLFQFIYQSMPVFRMLQYPVKLLFAGAFCLAIMAGMGSMQFFHMVDQEKILRGYTKGLAFFFLFLVTIFLIMISFQDPLYKWFLTIYRHEEYYQKIKEASFFAVYDGLLNTIILYAVFFIVFLATSRRKLGTHIGKCIAMILVILDLIYIGRPKEPYIPESAFIIENQTVNFLKSDTSLFRIFSFSYANYNKSFMHSYTIPFLTMYNFFQEEMLPNLNIYYHISSADAYADILQRSYFNLFSPIQHYFDKIPHSRNMDSIPMNILNLLNVKYIVSTFSLDESRLKLVKDDRVKIYENPECLPRAFFVEHLLLVDSEETILESIHHPSFDPGKMVYISKVEMAKLYNGFISESKEDEQEPFSGSITFTDYQPNVVSIKIQSNKARFLVFSDNYYPGWKAYVNGKEKSVLRVNYTLRGLLLEKGINTIIFVFKPLSFFVGAGISIMSLMSVLGTLFVSRHQRYGWPVTQQGHMV